MESDDTFIDILTEDPCTNSESGALDESEDVDVISTDNASDFTLTGQSAPESSTDAVQSSISSPKTSDLTQSDEYRHFASSFAGDHNYCSTVLKEEVDSGKESDAKVIIESQQNEVLYCICRKPDVDQFMIGCDHCNEWYHGECIGITKQEAKKIKQFCCNACQEKNPELHTKYKKTKEHTSIEDEADEIPKKRSNRRCGECAACMKQDDCGKCDYCKDMRKFGGPNKKRQKCRLRQCLNKSRHLLDGSNPGNLSDEQYQPRMKTSRLTQLGHEDEVSKKKKHAIKLKHTRHPQGREQKLKRQLSEKVLRRKKRLASRDSVGMCEKTRQSSELPRQCYGPQCQKRARSNSKYCSHECGIQVAVRRIQELLPSRVKEWNETSCVANQKAEEKLSRIKKVQEATRAKLVTLDNESKELDDIIERATHLTAVNEEEADVEQETDLDLTIYCVTCGIPLVPKVALRHMEKCYMKNESLTSFGSVYKSLGNLFCDFYNSQQGTYCKRLRVLCPEHTKEPKVSPDEVCGCPLSNEQLEETDELCCVSKRNCVRHHCWEKLRRAQIDGQRVQLWLKLEEVYEQERSTRLAVAQRGGVLGLLLHRTIVES